MKQFYTSYYAKKGRDPKAVSISAKAPEYFKGRWYLHLAPSWAIINAYKYHGMTEEEYVDAYLELIIHERHLDAEEVVSDLEDGSILLCYERSDDFCHRHIAAEWVQRETGVLVKEWVEEKPRTVADDVLEF